MHDVRECLDGLHLFVQRLCCRQPLTPSSISPLFPIASGSSLSPSHSFLFHFCFGKGASVRLCVVFIRNLYSAFPYSRPPPSMVFVVFFTAGSAGSILP